MVVNACNPTTWKLRKKDAGLSLTKIYSETLPEELWGWGEHSGERGVVMAMYAFNASLQEAEAGRLW